MTKLTPLGRRRMRVTAAACVAASALVMMSPAPAPAAPPLPAPTRVEAIASPRSVRLTFIQPDDESRVDSYRITTSTGAVFSAQDAPVTLGPLANGVAVRFRVAAVRAGVVGAFSAPSNTVTPRPATKTNTWSRVGRLRQGRIAAAAVRLKNGNVLAVGGSSSGGPNDRPRRTAELYDPATKRWRATGSMDLARTLFTTTRLADGRVLVAGGEGDRGVPASTRLYNPATGRWSRGAPMLRPRASHTATLLRGGKVLVTGGWTGERRNASRTAELYNPKTNRWSRTASMRVGRASASAVRLRSGHVLVTGGTADIFGGGLRSSEIYSPATGRWVLAGDMKTVRPDEYWFNPDPVRLANGKVLVAGGFSGRRGVGAELFDPATRTWTATGRLHVPREEGHAIVGLGRSRVLALGGSDDFGPLKYAEVFDARTGRWTRVNDLRHERYAPLAVLLTKGQVLVAGGSARTGTRRSSELFTPR